MNRKIFSKRFSSEEICWAIFLCLSVLRIAITFPLYTQVDTIQSYDDMLFVKLALSIAHWDWLGPYDSLTLCKGPIYPLVLAAIKGAHLSYLGTLAFFHCVCVYYLLASCRQYFTHVWIWLILGIVLLFDPYEVSGRLLRNGIYVSLICVFIGVLLNMFIPQRGKQTKIIGILECIFVGICFGMLWYIREESLLLKLVVIIGSSCLMFHRLFVCEKITIHKICCGLLGVVFFYLAISSINYIFYNRFVTIETTSPPYTAAFGTLLSVEDPINKLGVMISKEKIHQISQCVPSVATIEKCMTQGDVYESWRAGSPEFSPETLYWHSRPDKNYVSGNFIEWQMRACVDQAGFYKNGIVATNYYEDMKRELDQAILSNKLQKSSDRFAFGSFFVDMNDWPFLIRGLKFGVPRIVFAEKYLLTPENSFSSTDGVKIKAISDSFHLNTWVKGDKRETTQWRSFSFVLWDKIGKIYNKFIWLIYALTIAAVIPTIIYVLYKKEWLIFYPIVICVSFIVIRYLLLCVIHVRGFDALNYGYFSAGYVSFSFLAMFLVDYLVMTTASFRFVRH